MRFILCIIVMGLLNGVMAHFSMTDPSPRAREFNPIPGNEKGIDDTKFVCGGHNTAGTTSTLAVGPKDVSMEAGPANHCGDCFAYITYDTTLPTADQGYFLIDKVQDYIKEGVPFAPKTVVLPAWLRNGPAIFRWQCFTLHQGPPEFYAYCSDVTITGGVDNGPIPTTMKMIGHMPKDGYGNCANINHDVGPAKSVAPGPEKATNAPTATGSPPTTAPPTSMMATPPPTPAAPAPAAPPAETDITVTQVVCKDQDGEEANCERLIDQAKTNGEDLCQTYAAWMSEHCAKSCNVCTEDISVCQGDSNEFCPFWADDGQCTSNPVWMKNNCGLSCGYCFQGQGQDDSNGLQLQPIGIASFLFVLCLVYLL